MEVIKATNQEHFVDALRIRAHIFVGEQKVSVEEEIDDYDRHVPIFIAYDGEKALGTGRVIIESDYAKIGRVAVIKESRNSGIGKELILSMMTYLKENTDVLEVRLGAQVSAQSFYEKLGYEAYGPIFQDAGIEHISMKYLLRDEI